VRVPQDASAHGMDVAINARALANVYANRTNPLW
jgi:hypothetical protein